MSTTATRPTQSATSNVKPIPEGMHTVTPHLVCAGAADAIDFYKKAFKAEEMARMPTPQGKLMHAAIRIGDSVIMLADEFPDWGSVGPKTLKGTPVTIHLYAENADAFTAHAVEAGAKIVMPVEEMFWGDRYGVVEDPFGHRWSVATHVRDVSPEDALKAGQKMCGWTNVLQADKKLPRAKAAKAAKDAKVDQVLNRLLVLHP